MRRLILLTTLLLMPSGPLFAGFGWGSGNPLDNGTHDGDKKCSTGLSLSLGGTFDGATVQLQVQSFRSADTEFLDVVACSLSAPGRCSAFVGGGDLRIVISGGGTPTINAIGECAQGVIAFEGGSGSGSTSFAALTTGVNTMADMSVGSGASMRINGTGTIDASSLDFQGDGTRNVFNDAGATRFDPDNDGVIEMSLTVGGDLGIGVASPAAGARLHLQQVPTGAPNISGTLVIEHDNNSVINIVSGEDMFARIRYGDSDDASMAEISYNNTTDDLVFRTNNFNDNRLVVDSTGNIGIDTSTPDRRLDINDPGNPQIRLTQADGSIFSELHADSAGNLTLTANVSVTIGAGLTFAPPQSASPPVACAAPFDGHIYWDINQSLMCRCNSVTWQGLNVGGGGAVTCT